MGGLRDAISEPQVVSFAHARLEPFSFLVAAELPPRGIYTQSDPATGIVNSNHPWGSEQAIPLDVTDRGKSGYLIRYVFPLSDVDMLLAFCFDSTLDGFHELMVGRDYGDDVCALVARRWPHTFNLLLRGCGAPGWPALIRLVTSRPQWAVVVPFATEASSQEFEIPSEIATMHLDGSMEMLSELLDHETLVPELMVILSGDDYLRRTLKGAVSIIGALGDLSDIVDSLN